MRRGHLIILVGGAAFLILALVVVELLTYVMPNEDEVATSEAEARALLEEARHAIEGGASPGEVDEVPARRGRMLDRNGEVLAHTKPEPRLRLNLARLLVDYRELKGRNVPVHRYFVPRGNDREMIVEDDVFAVAHELLIQPARDHGLTLAIKSDEIYEHGRHWPSQAFYVTIEQATRLDADAGDRQAEAMSFLVELTETMAGAQLEEYGHRFYPLGALAAYVVGVVDLRTGAGIAGAELRFDEKLRGIPGERVVGGPDGGTVREAIPGGDLRLTLDQRAQRNLAESLARVERGGGILLDAGTAQILALAVAPALAPEVLAPGHAAALEENALEEDRDFPGITKLLGALQLLAESGGDVALQESLVRRLAEGGEAGAETAAAAGRMAARLGLTPGGAGEGDSGAGADGASMPPLTAMQLAALGAALAQGEVIHEPQLALGEVAVVRGRFSEASLAPGQVREFVQALGGGGKDEAGGLGAASGGETEAATWSMSGPMTGGGAWLLAALSPEQVLCLIDEGASPASELEARAREFAETMN